MAPASSVLLFSLLSLLPMTRAQDRAPHGLAYESPMAFSPSAVDFFRPNTENPSAASNSSPLPLAATVASTLAYESKSMPDAGRSQLGAGGIAVIVSGVVCAVLLAMGVYYVVVTRRANLNRTNSVKPDA